MGLVTPSGQIPKASLMYCSHATLYRARERTGNVKVTQTVREEIRIPCGQTSHGKMSYIRLNDLLFSGFV